MKTNINSRTRRGFCTLLATVAIAQWSLIAYKATAIETATIVLNKHAKEGTWSQNVQNPIVVIGNIKTCQYVRSDDTCANKLVWRPTITRTDWFGNVIVISPGAWVDSGTDPDNDCAIQPLSIAGHHGEGASTKTLSESCPAAPTAQTGPVNRKHTDTLPH